MEDLTNIAEPTIEGKDVCKAIGYHRVGYPVLQLTEENNPVMKYYCDLCGKEFVPIQDTKPDTPHKTADGDEYAEKTEKIQPDTLGIDCIIMQ